MSKGMVIGLVTLVILVVTIITIGGSLIGSYNQAATLKNTYEAKVSANEAEFDNMKKKICQVAQVSDSQMNKLKDIFTSYADARTGKGNNGDTLMKWIQESIPNIDTSTYKNLQNLIVESRNGWTMRQTELVDYSRQYNQLLVTFPTNIILKTLGFEKIVPKIITSSDTEKAFATGKDDDTNVFSK